MKRANHWCGLLSSRALLFVGALFISLSSYAQISLPTLPYSFSHRLEKPLLFERLTRPNAPGLLHVTSPVGEIDAPSKHDEFEFGTEIFVNYHTQNSGTWETLPNGDRLWRLGITSDSACSLNLLFDCFFLPEGGTLHIYTADGDYLLGAFTAANNQPSGQFATSLLPGGSVVLEYYEPKAARYQAAIHLSTVVHGYKDFYFVNGKYGLSGSCNIDINCSEGSGCQDVKKAVCLILYRSRILCTGTLINNVLQDKTPYLLTAYHCLSGKEVSQFVFIFNHEAISCGSQTYTDGYAINGAQIVDMGYNSDFALLKLSSAPPLHYHVYYAGWDARDTTSGNSCCIHHPSGDVKKISLCRQPLQSSDNQGDSGSTHWKVPCWSMGTTETGSSGSALFNRNNQVIGQLDGGTASCLDTTGFDVFGKFSASWERQESSAYGLRHWLDPLNSGITVCNGLNADSALFARDAAMLEILSPSENCCQQALPIRVCWVNNGSETISRLQLYFQLDESEPQLVTRTGRWDFADPDTLLLCSLDTLSDGDHRLKVWLQAAEDEHPLNDTLVRSFQYHRGASLHWQIKTDNHPSQTRWVLKDTDGKRWAESPDELGMRAIYADTFCLPEGCYDFVIEDDGGDGLGGSNGYEGYYYLFLQGKCIATGIRFGYRDSVRFCIDSSLATFAANRLEPDAELRVSPNPCAGDYLSLHMVSASDRSSFREVRLLSAEGRLLKQLAATERIYVGDLPSGVYFLQTVHLRHLQTAKFVIFKP